MLGEALWESDYSLLAVCPWASTLYPLGLIFQRFPGRGGNRQALRKNLPLCLPFSSQLWAEPIYLQISGLFASIGIPSPISREPCSLLSLRLQASPEVGLTSKPTLHTFPPMRNCLGFPGSRTF